jgi:hypothetical protein
MRNFYRLERKVLLLTKKLMAKVLALTEIHGQQFGGMI